MGTNFGEELMGRMAEIDANLRELPDYEKGVQAERERIITLLENALLEPEAFIALIRAND